MSDPSSDRSAELETSKNGAIRPPDPEVLEKPVRRTYTAEYKQRILEETDNLAPEEVGAVLRREGLYRSHLSRWCSERQAGQPAGIKPKKRGRKAKPDHPWANKVAQLERENARLQRKLEQAEKIIEVQKKLSELFGLDETPPGGSR